MQLEESPFGTRGVAMERWAGWGKRPRVLLVAVSHFSVVSAVLAPAPMSVFQGGAGQVVAY